MMILVTGATGTAGSQVVRALLRRGVRVRAFVRDPGTARTLFGDAVELAVGDFADGTSMRAALQGADAVVLSCADDPRRVGWENDAIDLAASRVGKVVKLSSIGAEPGAPVAFWDWHGRVERHLRRSGIPAVILRSSVYMSNVLWGAEEAVAEGRLYAPAGGARITMIDPRDVGEAAAAAVTSGHDGRTYTLTGPQAIAYDDIAAALSRATGREVAFVDVPGEVAQHQMVQAGLSELIAAEIVRLFAALRRGAAEQVTTHVEGLIGRPPRDFAAFARDHARLFAPALRALR